MPSQTKQLMNIYTLLYNAFGSRNWWPADTAEEVIFGAILTQSTTWKNVEQAISALKEQKKLSFRAVAALDERRLAEIIRPARFLNQKARALKAFADYFGNHYRFRIKNMKKRELWALREVLIPLKVSTCYAPKFPPVPVQSFHLIQSNVSTDRRSEATV